MSSQPEDALDFDLFAGDFGEPGDRCLSNKIVKCRKAHRCHICEGSTVPGEKALSATYVFSGELHSYYCCTACVDAMAKSVTCDYDLESDEDPIDPIDARYALGDEVRANRKNKLELVL
ncbi:MAG: hypothetical protein WAU54_19995 [Chania sp.]